MGCVCLSSAWLPTSRLLLRSASFPTSRSLLRQMLRQLLEFATSSLVLHHAKVRKISDSCKFFRNFFSKKYTKGTVAESTSKCKTVANL